MNMKSIFVNVALLGLLGMASATPVKLNDLPVQVEVNSKLYKLTTDGIRAIFPSAAGRPDAVFMTADRKVSVAFEWREGKLAPNEVGLLVKQFPAVIRAQVPNVTKLDSDLIKVGSKPWAKFVMTTPSKGDQLRRELLMTSASGRILVVTIAGNVKDYVRNQAVIQKLTKSIKVF